MDRNRVLAWLFLIGSTAFALAAGATAAVATAAEIDGDADVPQVIETPLHSGVNPPAIEQLLSIPDVVRCRMWNRSAARYLSEAVTGLFGHRETSRRPREASLRR